MNTKFLVIGAIVVVLGVGGLWYLSHSDKQEVQQKQQSNMPDYSNFRIPNN